MDNFSFVKGTFPYLLREFPNNRDPCLRKKNQKGRKMTEVIGEPNVQIVEIQGRRYRKRHVESKSTITLGDFMSGTQCPTV